MEGLRTATGSLHARLDAGLPIGHAQAVLADYVSHLLMLRPWLVKSQAMLRATEAAGLKAAADRIGERLKKIDADLADVEEPSHAGASVETSTQDAFAGSEAAAYGWGRAYVVEGSGLGGRVLFKRLRARLAPHPLRYLAGDTAVSQGAGWSDFTTQLDLQLASSAQRLQAQQGAVDAFSELLDSLALNTKA